MGPSWAAGPLAGQNSGPHLPTSEGMWLALLWMVLTPERDSCLTLVLSVAPLRT